MEYSNRKKLLLVLLAALVVLLVVLYILLRSRVTPPPAVEEGESEAAPVSPALTPSEQLRLIEQLRAESETMPSETARKGIIGDLRAGQADGGVSIEEKARILELLRQQ